jgi:hypothetical protein
MSAFGEKQTLWPRNREHRAPDPTPALKLHPWVFANGASQAGPHQKVAGDCCNVLDVLGLNAIDIGCRPYSDTWATAPERLSLASKLDALLKLSIIAGVLFASASVGYYFLVYLPQRDAQFDAERVQAKKQAEAAAQAQQERQADVAADAQIPNQGPLENPYADAEEAAVKLLNQSLQGVDSCYRGAHQWFKDDLVGRAYDALLKKVIQPDELCDRYLRHLSDVPIEVHVTPVPGVSLSVSTEKLCALVQHRPCPE